MIKYFSGTEKNPAVLVPQLLHNTERFSCENATEHNLTLSAYLPLLYTLLCVLFSLACASQGMCWQEPAEQPHTGETLCDTRRMRNISAVEPHVVSSVHVWPPGIRVQCIKEPEIQSLEMFCEHSAPLAP